jgi:putative ABC transport system substrate-binding protein
MRRRDFLGVLSGAAVWPQCVKAQQTKPIVAVISPLSAQAAVPNIEALRQGLHDLSLDEARDFTFALRFFDGNIALAPTMRQDFRFWTQNGGWA